MHAPFSCCAVARGGARACGGGGAAARATNGVGSSHLCPATGRWNSCSPRRIRRRSRYRSRWCSLGCSRHHTTQCTSCPQRGRRRSLDLLHIPYNLLRWPRCMVHRSVIRVRCHGSNRCSWCPGTMGDDCRTCCSVCLTRRRPASRCRVRSPRHICRSYLRSAAAARGRSFHRCSFRH